MDTSNSPDQQLNEEQRANRLVMHVARLVQRGAEVEHHHPTRAIVRMRQHASIIPNLVMLLGGIVLFAVEHGVLFLAASLLSAVGWYRKHVGSTIWRRIVVRVDERGKVREVPLDA
jgi:hypothetical protein